MKNKIYMRKIIFIFMIFSLVSYSKGLGKITEKFVGECGENDREHLRVLENKQRKMDEYNKLKQELVNSQENWLKSVYEELEDLTKDIFFDSVCTGEQFAAEKKISLIQQRIQELTNEYKKYLD